MLSISLQVTMVVIGMTTKFSVNINFIFYYYSPYFFKI